MKTILVLIAVAFGGALNLWTLITPDVLALGLDDHVVSIVGKMLTAGVGSTVMLAAFYQVAVPSLTPAPPELKQRILEEAMKSPPVTPPSV